MSAMLEIYANLRNVFFAALLFLFCASCDFLDGKGGKTNIKAGSGAANSGRLVFSRSCAAGSLKIYKKFTGQAAGQAVSAGYRLSDVGPGEQVEIQGTVNKSPCYPGPASFRCIGQPISGNVNMFSCSSGAVSAFGAAPASLAAVPASPAAAPISPSASPSSAALSASASLSAPVFASNARSFLGGRFQVWGHGHNLSVNVFLSQEGANSSISVSPSWYGIHSYGVNSALYCSLAFVCL